MTHLSIGKRFKDYEKAYNIKLPKRFPIILRIDGRAFHTYTKNFNKPFDIFLIEAMIDTAKYLCENISGAQIAYIQSDEISIFIHNYKRLETEPWFSNKIQKIVSVAASMATLRFNENMRKYAVEKNGAACFDARVFIVSGCEVINYFIWRQQDWERNSLQMFARSLYSHKDLKNKNKYDLHEMCFKKDKNWNDLPTHLKRGSCIYKKRNHSDDVIDLETPATEWFIDRDIPIFTKDRIFIEQWLEILEK